MKKNRFNQNPEVKSSEFISFLKVKNPIIDDKMYLFAQVWTAPRSQPEEICTALRDG